MQRQQHQSPWQPPEHLLICRSFSRRSNLAKTRNAWQSFCKKAKVWIEAVARHESLLAVTLILQTVHPLPLDANVEHWSPPVDHQTLLAPLLLRRDAIDG